MMGELMEYFRYSWQLWAAFAVCFALVAFLIWSGYATGREKGYRKGYEAGADNAESEAVTRSDHILKHECKISYDAGYAQGVENSKPKHGEHGRFVSKEHGDGRK